MSVSNSRKSSCEKDNETSTQSFDPPQESESPYVSNTTLLMCGPSNNGAGRQNLKVRFFNEKILIKAEKKTRQHTSERRDVDRRSKDLLAEEQDCLMEKK